MDYMTCDIPIGSYVIFAPRDVFTMPFLMEVKGVTRCFVYLKPLREGEHTPRRHRRGLLALIPPGISTEASRTFMIGRLMDVWVTKPDRDTLLARYRAVLDEVLHNGEQA